MKGVLTGKPRPWERNPGVPAVQGPWAGRTGGALGGAFSRGVHIV